MIVSLQFTAYARSRVTIMKSQNITSYCESLILVFTSFTLATQDRDHVTYGHNNSGSIDNNNNNNRRLLTQCLLLYLPVNGSITPRSLAGGRDIFLIDEQSRSHYYNTVLYILFSVRCQSHVEILGTVSILSWSRMFITLTIQFREITF